MPEWSFVLRVNQALTPEQADAFDHCDAFADGSVSYVLGPEEPGAAPVPHRPDELTCDVEAPTLLDAVARVARDVRLVPGLRAVGAAFPGTVTLQEAAQRCGHSPAALARLAAGRDGPGGFPEPLPALTPDATVFYPWQAVAAFLEALDGKPPPAVRELAVADGALRLADALEGVDASPGTLRSLGLPVC
jgi:hypothetical protein